MLEASASLTKVTFKNNVCTVQWDFVAEYTSTIQIRIDEDGEILWNEFLGWNGIDKKLLNLKVLKYEFDIKVWLTGNKGGYYQILVVEVE